MESSDTRDDAHAMGDPEQNLVPVEADRIALRRVFEEGHGTNQRARDDPMTRPTSDADAGTAANEREL